ncbi:MAG TPA: SusD/RagB family nutrient-binding outer membrane lipoprotein, partial [Chitinophagaceae bacterium]|nr:SusD/RagB family nutrient-binding outer membrane lipoprotein [Chitinophagaceae bacterium]
MKPVNIFYSLAVAAAITTASSCEKGFEEINTDPNRISVISPGTLLNPIIYEVASFNMQKSDDVTFDLMQVSLAFPSPTGGIHRYEITENTGNSTWNTYYRWLNNIREMKRAADSAKDVNYQAIAMTLNAWVYSNLTDCFGDVPMDEAVSAEDGILQPKYNKQQEIYTRILADLDSANKLFSTSKAMVYGTDILYANNVTNWKRFCNSLRMRLLLRVSNRTEMDSWNTLRTMIANPATYPVFTANDNAAVLKLTGVTPLISPWGRPQDFTTGRAAAKFFLDSLNAMNDPRRAKFASQARNASGSANIGYKGIPSGYAGSENQFDYIPSNLVQAVISAPMICPVLTYAEVEFIRSEVYFRDNNHDSAKAAYERGVKAAIEQWGAAMPAN